MSGKIYRRKNDNFKESIKTQKQNKEESLTKEVIKVIKELENFIKNTMVNRKCVMVYVWFERKNISLKKYQERMEKQGSRT